MSNRTAIQRQLADETGFGLVETLIALTIFVIGLVAVSGLTVASADQARIANWRSQQGAAAQMLLEDIQQDGWAAAASGTDTVTVGGHPFKASVAVSTVTPRVKRVVITIAAVGDVDSVTYRSHLYKPRPLPDP